MANGAETISAVLDFLVFVISGIVHACRLGSRMHIAKHPLHAHWPVIVNLDAVEVGVAADVVADVARRVVFGGRLITAVPCRGTSCRTAPVHMLLWRCACTAWWSARSTLGPSSSLWTRLPTAWGCGCNSSSPPCAICTSLAWSAPQVSAATLCRPSQ